MSMANLEVERADAPDSSSKLLTIEEFLALPEEDGIERDLIDGRLVEQPMSRRNPNHGATEANIIFLLKDWHGRKSEPRGRIYGADVSYRLRPEPETLVCIDVTYASVEQVEAWKQNRKRSYFEGPPVLAVEILSPSDTHARVTDKVTTYLEVGTVVWVVDPDLRTVIVYRPGASVQIFGETDELVADPYLPGFRVAVARIFED